MENTQPLGLDIQIQTPENVLLKFQLAGPGLRIGAYLLDFMIQAALIFAISMVVICAGLAGLGGYAVGFWLITIFFIYWFYPIACEMIYEGRSIGQKVIGLRVIKENGCPIDFWSSVIRNLLRVVDLFTLYGVGFIVAMLSPRFQRFGDLFARTMVVTERQVVLPREPVIVEKIDPISHDDMNGYIPSKKTLSLIDQFLGRRNVLSIGRGHEIAYPLSITLARKLQFRGDPQQVKKYPMAFLARVYVTFIRVLDDEETFEDEARPWEQKPTRTATKTKWKRDPNGLKYNRGESIDE